MEKRPSDWQPLQERPFTTQEGVQKRLEYLRDVLAWSWPKIARSKEFSPIPVGTLYKVYSTGEVPKKWWGRLNVRATAYTERVAIHKFDMDSAVSTIMSNIEMEKISELLEKLLNAYAKEFWERRGGTNE